MKKIIALLLALACCAAIPVWAEDKAVTNVEVFTYTPSVGQSLERIQITVSDAALLEGLTAADFSLSGLCGQWGTAELHPFSVTTSGVAAEGNVLTISFTNFNEKYLYVASWTCECANPALTFTMEDVTATHIEIADDFEKVRVEDGAEFGYNLFVPEDTSVPQPLVLALHGMGDTDNLQQNRLCIAWAEPQNQAVRPCYVLAPLFPLNGWNFGSTEEVLSKAIDMVHDMIADGKVDPSRVYVVGKSMGGYNTIKALTRFNADGLFAAGIVMAGWVDAGLTEDEIANAAHTPVYVIHGEQDPLVAAPGAFYDLLVGLGNENAFHFVYTEREYRNHKCGSQHDVEILAMEDRTFAEWLFAQSK